MTLLDLLWYLFCLLLSIVLMVSLVSLGSAVRGWWRRRNDGARTR